jgi:hypothetical protein
LNIYADKGTAKPIEDMARQLVGDVEDEVCLQLARTVAEEQFALARVRHTKVGLIESIRVLAKSTWEVADSTEARCALPDLVKLDRYERRAIARRDAVRERLKRNSLRRTSLPQNFLLKETVRAPVGE